MRLVHVAVGWWAVLSWMILLVLLVLLTQGPVTLHEPNAVILTIEVAAFILLAPGLIITVWELTKTTVKQ